MDTYLKLAVIQAGLLLFQSLTYFLIQKVEGPAHNVARPVDERIPLVPPMIFIYILWYPLIALFPLLLYDCSGAEAYYAYMAGILLDILVSLAIYMAYPTWFSRPVPPEKGLSGKVLRIVYKGNYKGKNCMPSMHCSMCFFIIMSVAGCPAMAPWIRAAVCVLAGLIVLSTVLTKQHMLIDVLVAVPVALVCYFAGRGLCLIGGCGNLCVV